MAVIHNFLPMKGEGDSFLPTMEDDDNPSENSTSDHQNQTPTVSLIKIKILISVILAFSSLALILLAHNIKPNYIPQFHIESLSLSSFDISSSKLSAKWIVSFSTKNPCNVTTYFYDNLEASIYYGKKLLALTMVEAFYQQRRDKMYFGAGFGISEVTVEEWAARAISRVQEMWEPLPFNVMVRARVKVDPGKSSGRTFQLKVWCEDVHVRLYDNWWKSGLMQGGPKKCKDAWAIDKE